MRDGGDEFDKEYSHIPFGITAAVDVDNQVIRFSDQVINAGVFAFTKLRWCCLDNKKAIYGGLIWTFSVKIIVKY